MWCATQFWVATRSSTTWLSREHMQTDTTEDVFNSIFVVPRDSKVWLMSATCMQQAEMFLRTSRFDISSLLAY